MNEWKPWLQLESQIEPLNSITMASKRNRKKFKLPANFSSLRPLIALSRVDSLGNEQQWVWDRKWDLNSAKKTDDHHITSSPWSINDARLGPISAPRLNRSNLESWGLQVHLLLVSWRQLNQKRKFIVNFFIANCGPKFNLLMGHTNTNTQKGFPPP